MKSFNIYAMNINNKSVLNQRFVTVTYSWLIVFNDKFLCILGILTHHGSWKIATIDFTLVLPVTSVLNWSKINISLDF